MSLKQKFEELLLATERKGIENLLETLEITDFYTAPASTHFHGSYPGGLLEHSMNVRSELIILSNSLNFEIKELEKGTLDIVSLLHDICKINCYKSYMRNVKNSAGQWEQKESYMWNSERLIYGHGEESVRTISDYIKLTFEEQFAIRYHMGAYVEGDMRALSNVYREYPLAMYLHFADITAASKEDKGE